MVIGGNTLWLLEVSKYRVGHSWVNLILSQLTKDAAEKETTMHAPKLMRCICPIKCQGCSGQTIKQ